MLPSMLREEGERLVEKCRGKQRKSPCIRLGSEDTREHEEGMHLLMNFRETFFFQKINEECNNYLFPEVSSDF